MARLDSHLSVHTPFTPALFIILFAGVATAQVNNAAILDRRASGQSPNTAVAMIVLYVVTGCVSALFIIIIISGAIKAIRNPDRYGPRARNLDGENGWSQSRARGLTRAILDTFPTVKFTSQEPERARATPSKDIEAHPEPGVIMSTRAVHLNTEYTEAVSEPSSSSPNENGSRPAESSPPADGPVDEPEPSSSLQPPNAEAIPDAIGRETCPICIVDFEEGDDLRILPCDGAHCFHQSCVDPWLLELSTACPICRQDFIALENMISGGSEDPDSNRRSSRLRRFSRYLRFARHRHEQDAGENNAVSG